MKKPVGGLSTASFTAIVLSLVQRGACDYYSRDIPFETTDFVMHEIHPCKLQNQSDESTKQRHKVKPVSDSQSASLTCELQRTCKCLWPLESRTRRHAPRTQ